MKNTKKSRMLIENNNNATLKELRQLLKEKTGIRCKDSVTKRVRSLDSKKEKSSFRCSQIMNLSVYIPSH